MPGRNVRSLQLQDLEFIADLSFELLDVRFKRVVNVVRELHRLDTFLRLLSLVHLLEVVESDIVGLLGLPNHVALLK